MLEPSGAIEENHIIEFSFFAGFRIFKTFMMVVSFFGASGKDYKHVVYKGRTYTRIGKRLFTQHAVDRMSPSGLGNAAGGSQVGVAPEIVEQVINEGTSTTNIVNGVTRTIFKSGDITVVTEESGKIILTVIEN